MPQQQHHLNLRVQQQGPTALVSLSGELDICSRQEVTDAIDGLDIGGRVKQLVLDLRGLEFMDSAGIRLLYERDAAARADGHNLALVHGGRHVREICSISGMDGRLIFVDHPADLRPPV